jgi:hypothetical protein
VSGRNWNQRIDFGDATPNDFDEQIASGFAVYLACFVAVAIGFAIFAEAPD